MLKARRRRSKLSMTSLIDVIFLLLLFFMLTSTFTKFAEVELLSGVTGSGSGPTPTPPLFVQARADSLSLNARPVTLDSLAEAIAAQRSADQKQPLLVSLGPQTTAQRLTDLLLVLRALPGLSITVLEGRT